MELFKFIRLGIIFIGVGLSNCSTPGEYKIQGTATGIGQGMVCIISYLDKIANTENPDGLVNGTIDTNVGLLRAYMTIYLRRHPFISKDLLFMVRTLAPTENGLPMQIYCFSINKNWPSYESIQAEIMEHFVSVLPEFELYPFQNPSARDYIISSLIEAEKDLSTINAIPWHSVQSKEK